MRRYLFHCVAAIVLGAATLIGCSDSDETGCKGEGFTRCLGVFPPDAIEHETSEQGDDVQKLIWYAGEEGPRCIKEFEEEYRSFIRAGDPSSKDLAIYLPPDGAWLVQSRSVLLQGGHAPYTYADRTKTIFTENTPFDFLQKAPFLYVSACDGSLYLSDKDYTSDMLHEVLEDTDLPNKDTNPRFYRGFINATASVNELARQYPDPERVFLFGSLAGAFGVIGLAAHTAELFPNADIFIFQDGSPAMAMGDVDKSFYTTMVKLWGADKMVPKDAGEYGESGHVLTLMNWVLERYDNVYAATFASAKEISIPTIINLAHTNTDPISAEIYECFVTSTLEYVRSNAEAKADGRYNYYVVNQNADNIGELRGRDRTGDQENYALELQDGSDGPTVKEWINQLVHKSPDWTSHSEIPMTLDKMGHCKDVN